MGFLHTQLEKMLAEAREFTAQARADFGALGEGSLIKPPIECQHPEHMFFGRVHINSHCWIGTLPSYAGVAHTPRLEVGDGTSFGHGTHLFCATRMKIGCHVLIADHVYITDNLHGYEDIELPPAKQPLKVPGPVTIGDETWIGERACVMPNVTIGRHCVIGAAAVVTHSIPDYCVAAGIPAIVIKHYDVDKKSWVRVSCGERH